MSTIAGADRTPKMENFIFSGFSIKCWPWAEGYYTGSNWDSCDEIENEIIKNYDVYINNFQLLMPRSNDVMLKINDLIINLESANILSVKLPLSLVKFTDHATGYNVAANSVCLQPYTFVGLDICDMNGLFTGLSHPEIDPPIEGLIDRSKYISALELALHLNFIDREHRPYAVTENYILKTP